MRNTNQQLVQITPGRTLEAIKEVRKSTPYWELLASLQLEAESSELIEREPVGPDPGSPNDLPHDTTPILALINGLSRSGRPLNNLASLMTLTSMPSTLD